MCGHEQPRPTAERLRSGRGSAQFRRVFAASDGTRFDYVRTAMRIRVSFDNIRTDVRHAVRSLRRSPGFAAVAILALAVGIGGNTAVFSVVDATRAQAIPYEDPERLVNLIGNVDRGERHRAQGRLVSRLPRLAGAGHALVRRSRRGRFADADAVRDRRTGAHRDRVRVGVLLPAAACDGGAWPDVSRRRGPGLEARRRSSSSAMACGSAGSAPIRRCSAAR